MIPLSLGDIGVILAALKMVCDVAEGAGMMASPEAQRVARLGLKLSTALREQLAAANDDDDSPRPTQPIGRA